MIEGLEIKGARHQVTLPIATVLLMLDGVPKEKPHFIKLWEKHSGTTVDAALTMGQLRPYELTAPALRYPPSFFAGSRKPFQIIGRLYQKNIPEMEKAVLPCQPGDALWLVHKFLEDTFPEGGDLTVVPVFTGMGVTDVFSQMLE